MSTNHIAIISLPVSDQTRARQFYTEALGFAVVRDNPFQADARWIELAPPGAQTTIVLVTWFPWMPPGSIHGLVLDVDDVAAAHARLMAHGVAVAPVEEAPWGKFTSFNDPDGNGWVVQESAHQPVT